MQREGRKYEHYFVEYEDKFKNVNPLRILEIGVQSGKSLLYWRNMFPDTEIVGVDIDPGCLKFSDEKNNNRCDKNYTIENRFGVESITFIESVVFIKKQKEDKDYKLPF